MVQTIDVMGGGSQAQAAATRIKAAIHGAQFGPGQRLVESELVQLLGVGRGPVREALRLLSVEGFVRIERNKGAVVAQASKAIVAEAFEVRELLEGLCARRAARHVREDRKSTPSELQSLMRISYAVFCLKKNKLK